MEDGRCKMWYGHPGGMPAEKCRKITYILQYVPKNLDVKNESGRMLDFFLSTYTLSLYIYIYGVYTGHYEMDVRTKEKNRSTTSLHHTTLNYICVYHEAI